VRAYRAAASGTAGQHYKCMYVYIYIYLYICINLCMLAGLASGTAGKHIENADPRSFASHSAGVCVCCVCVRVCMYMCVW